MTQGLNSTSQPIHPASLGKQMLLGAGIALIPIVLLLSGVKDPNPAWGKLWMVRPLIIVPLAGAVGGAFFYFTGYLRNQGGSKKVLAIVLSLVVYIIGLWLGIVLGLDGTLWD